MQVVVDGFADHIVVASDPKIEVGPSTGRGDVDFRLGLASGWPEKIDRGGDVSDLVSELRRKGALETKK
eukprot:1285760-Rhodomonas_salina.1